MEKIVTFGARKFVCKLKKVRVKGKQEKYIFKVFCREIKNKANSRANTKTMSSASNAIAKKLEIERQADSSR